MRSTSNPLFNRLLIQNRVGRGNVRRFAGAEAAPGVLTSTDAVTTATQQQAANPGTLNVGRRSSMNVETPLHGNAITLKLENLGINGTGGDPARADLVLTSGRFGARYPQQITDGTQTIVNDDGVSVDVNVEAEYGVDGTSDSWAEMLKWIELDGLAVASTRINWTQDAQRQKKIRFQYMDAFGDHTLDHIFPEVYHDPKNYDLKTVQSDIGYPLDAKTVMKLSIVPGETVLLTFWIAAIYEKEQIIREFLRARGGNSLG